jgi:hypothetical protein
MKNLNLRIKTMKFIEENVMDKLYHNDMSNISITQKHRKQKKK